MPAELPPPKASLTVVAWQQDVGFEHYGEDPPPDAPVFKVRICDGVVRYLRVDADATLEQECECGGGKVHIQVLSGLRLLWVKHRGRCFMMQ